MLNQSQIEGTAVCAIHVSASKHVEPFFFFFFILAVLFTIVCLKHMITLHLLEWHIINKMFISILYLAILKTL